MSVQLPPVVGDPAGMRALAAAIRSIAAQLAAVESTVSGRVGGLSFTGPAATRLAAAIGSWSADLVGTVDALQSTASLLDRSAAEVETEQAARARALHRLDAEALPRR